MGAIHCSLLEDKIAGDSKGPFALNTPRPSFALQGQTHPQEPPGCQESSTEVEKAHLVLRQLTVSPP